MSRHSSTDLPAVIPSTSARNVTDKIELVKSVPTFVWTIKNFCSCRQKPAECLRSPSFSIGNNDDLKWCLHLYPRGFEKKYSDYVSLFLQYEAANTADVWIKYKFALLSDEGEPLNELGCDSDRHFSPGSDWGFREFLLRDSLFDSENGYLPNDKLSVSCEIEVITYKTNIFSSGPVVPMKLNDCQTRLLDNFEELMKSKNLHDVTFIVGDKKLYAHKAILAARSPVFAAMFEHDMQEKQANLVEVVDIDHKVFKEVLRFIYCGKVEELKKIASDILPVAEMYALLDLKSLCENSISKYLTAENVSDILIMADQFNATNLKNNAINFIISYGDQIINTEGFKTLVSSQSSLITEVFQAMAVKCSSSKMHEDKPNRKRKNADCSNKEKVPKTL